MKLKPINDNIMAQIIRPEEITRSGIIIPQAAQERSQFAVVLEVGPGRLMASGQVKPLMIKPGDRVLLARFGGNEVKVEGEIFLFLKEEEILAVDREHEEELSCPDVNKEELINAINATEPSKDLKEFNDRIKKESEQLALQFEVNDKEAMKTINATKKESCCGKECSCDGVNSFCSSCDENSGTKDLTA